MKPLKGYSYLYAFAFFSVITIFIRPVFPIDETRYLTVAWEMFLNKNYFLLTLNFEPYHHKPPMLFWLINLCWSVFGVHRWAAQIPVFLSASCVLILTMRLAKNLYPQSPDISKYLPWLLLGSLPFLIYSTLIMFDLMLTLCVLGVLISFLSYCERPHFKSILIAGLIMGGGVLVKGPVTYLYVLWPMLLYPYWKQPSYTATTKQAYKATGLAVLISVIPVLCWLVPALLQADQNFAYWIIWEQTAGRVHGDFSASHVRPFYFYFLLAPILFMPWCFKPSFWKGLTHINTQDKQMRFILSATLPTFLSFCMIAGKQPHYLVPLLPFVIIFISLCVPKDNSIKKITALIIAIFLIGQITLSDVLMTKYDLTPMAEFYNQNSDHDFAFVRKYQGEIGFLGRIEQSIDSLEMHDLDQWFNDHPDGYAIVRYDLEEYPQYDMLYTIPYRGKHLGVFHHKPTLSQEGINPHE